MLHFILERALLDHATKIRSQPGSAEASILVVTADQGCREFCSKTPSLIPCSDINKAINLLKERSEILRLAQKSIELNTEFSKPEHSILSALKRQTKHNWIEKFPPHTFTFTKGGIEQSGWFKDCTFQSASLIPSGPQGALIEVTTETPLSIKGRVRFLLKIDLNKPCYTEGTASPSCEIVIKNHLCYLDINFSASQEEGQWWIATYEPPKQLVNDVKNPE